MAEDPFNLQRFVDAQAGGVYERALAEIMSGRKESHWMWFIFPQHRDLGRSPTAKFYGLSGEEEARAYRAHPVLGPGYRQSVAAVRVQVDAGPSTSSGQARLEAIFGELDAMKFRSSVEAFSIRRRRFDIILIAIAPHGKCCVPIREHPEYQRDILTVP